MRRLGAPARRGPCHRANGHNAPGPGPDPTATAPAPQPQQEETLDIEEIPLEEENLDEGVDGRSLTPLAALPAQTSSLIDQANEVNERFPVRGASRTPEIAAATETLRDPSATDAARERAESVLQQVISDGERMEELSRAEDIPNNATVYRGSVYVPATENTQNPVSVPGREGNWEYVGNRTPTPDPGQQVYRPMTEAQRERGETGMAGVVADINTPSDFSRQAGEAVSDISSSASNLAADIRDNAGMNFRRAYDAARETLGSAGSALMDFIRGGAPTQQEVDRQRFEAAKERERLEEERSATSVPDPETVATPEPTRGRGDVVENIPVRPEPGSPRQAQAEAELRERLEAEEDRLIEEQGVTMATPIEKGGVAFGSREERKDAKLEGRTQAFSNAVDLFKKLNAPFPVVAASQFVQESEQGISDLVQDTNNGFGIKYDEGVAEKFKERGIDAKKSDKTYRDSTEARTGAADPDAHYFSFPSVEEGFKAYLAFIELNPRYGEALASGSEMDYLRKLVNAGYATGSDGKGGGYTDAILKIAKGYGFNIEDVAPEEPTTK